MNRKEQNNSTEVNGFCDTVAECSDGGVSHWE